MRRTFEIPDFPVSGVSGLNWVLQEKQLGTGHAVQQAMSGISADLVLVLYGDVPLVRPDTLRELIALADAGKFALLTLETSSPRDSQNRRGADGRGGSLVEGATPTRNRDKYPRSTVA